MAAKEQKFYAQIAEVDGGDLMAQQGVNVQLSIKEIYDRLDDKGKKVVRDLIKGKLTDDMVDKVIGQ